MNIAAEKPFPSPAADPLPPAAIDVAHLVKHYKTTCAVDDVTFRIARGSITGLLGGNGAGKTTTIGMIIGLVAPSAGRVRVFGADMAREPYRVLGRINFESPYVDLPHRLTVRQNLTVFGLLYGVADTAAMSLKENSRPIAAPICAMSFTGVSRSRRASSEACNVVGMASDGSGPSRT